MAERLTLLLREDHAKRLSQAVRQPYPAFDKPGTALRPTAAAHLFVIRADHWPDIQQHRVHSSTREVSARTAAQLVACNCAPRGLHGLSSRHAGSPGTAAAQRRAALGWAVRLQVQPPQIGHAEHHRGCAQRDAGCRACCSSPPLNP